MTNSFNATSKENIDKEQLKDSIINETGKALLINNRHKANIYLLSIIGEIEGHENLPSNSKTTKYEHLLPTLAEIEDNKDIHGVLILLQTSGGDCSAGLAIAEMISSLSKPSVSLIIGDSHSIGVPLAVSTDYSFIVPSSTMIIHPVRMNGTVIGAPSTYEYFKIIQDRIVEFICSHSRISEERLEDLMLRKGVISNDLGTILVGADTIEEGLVNEIGGISSALNKLYELISHD